ncbi:MAG: YjzC family protein [Chloroflexi bacterium]|nr:YjzC family protein [Chloroflexota bacterium]
MAKTQNPGEKADRSGEYEERGPRGGKVPNPGPKSVRRNVKLPPTQKPGRKWKRIGPRKP